jgi:hypothetical protein
MIFSSPCPHAQGAKPLPSVAAAAPHPQGLLRDASLRTQARYASATVSTATHAIETQTEVVAVRPPLGGIASAVETMQEAMQPLRSFLSAQDSLDNDDLVNLGSGLQVLKQLSASPLPGTPEVTASEELEQDDVPAVGSPRPDAATKPPSSSSDSTPRGLLEDMSSVPLPPLPRSTSSPPLDAASTSCDLSVRSFSTFQNDLYLSQPDSIVPSIQNAVVSLSSHFLARQPLGKGVVTLCLAQNPFPPIFLSAEDPPPGQGCPSLWMHPRHALQRPLLQQALVGAAAAAVLQQQTLSQRQQ